MATIASYGSAAASMLPQLNATAQQAATAATSRTSSSSTGSSTAAGGSDITGTDFLTLLVSELKNQDPTQPTDPNTYVQQLVGVNSLQQLIQINQDLGGNGSASGTSTGAGGAGSSATGAV